MKIIAKTNTGFLLEATTAEINCLAGRFLIHSLTKETVGLEFDPLVTIRSIAQFPELRPQVTALQTVLTHVLRAIDAVNESVVEASKVEEATIFPEGD